MSKRKNTAYNNHGNLINNINILVISAICEVLFSLDFMDISILTGSPQGQLVKDLGKHLKLIVQKKEKHCRPSIWKDLFKIRTYFDIGDSQIWVMTEKARPLRNIDAIIRLPHPTPTNIIALEKVLDKIGIRNCWVSKLEPTFDIITDEQEHRDALQALLKKTLFLRHGRDAFKKGEDQVTNYINFRTSIKQTRLYQKDIIDDGITYPRLRFEFPIKRGKLFSEEINKPTDILKYNMRILEEIGFYQVDEIKLKRSLLDYDTNHFFSGLMANFINKFGFHSAQLWSRRIKECPVHCYNRASNTCKLMPDGKIIDGEQRFFAIQNCDYAKFIANFRARYCAEIEEMQVLKSLMLEAFQTWKKS